MADAPAQQLPGFLFDVRVLELADVKGEYCGKLLAGSGADVVKIEPPDGSPTRRFGPFYQDQEDPERSLHFWHYNVGKRGITLDITTSEGKDIFRQLVSRSDIVLETFPPGYMESLGLGYEQLSRLNPGLIMLSINAFGHSGPWRDWRGSDLVHLALGGVMMNCGYDRTPEGEYDTPPIAPQMWHSSHIVGAQAQIALLGALLWREQSGRGQYIEAPIHQAVSTSSEMDIPSWEYNRMPFFRQTGRHSSARPSSNPQAMTKDGRYVHCQVGLAGRSPAGLIKLLDDHGAAMDLTDPKYLDPAYTADPAVAHHIESVVKKWVVGYRFERDLWKEGQARELHFAAVRRPEENAADPHWQARKTFMQVTHEDIGRTFTYIGAPWLAETCPWREGPRAPHLGEHNGDVLGRELDIPAERLSALRQSGVI